MNQQASLDIRVWVECPHCKEELDLMDEADSSVANDDSPATIHVALRKWWTDNEDMPMDVTCGKCKGEFVVGEIVY